MKSIFITLTILAAAVSLNAQTSRWEPMNRGLLHLLVYTIECDPTQPLVMYAGTEYGNLYKSTDGGFNWKLSKNGIPDEYDEELVTALAVDMADHNTLYAGFGGRHSEYNLFTSSDGGASWEMWRTPETWRNYGVLHIYKTATQPSVMLCGLGWFGGTWRSSDNGLSWNKKLNDVGVQVIGGDFDSDGVMFAGTSTNGPLFRSVNGGKTWMVCMKNNPDFDAHSGCRALTVATHNTSLIFAGITGKASGRGLYKSLNWGDTWTRLNNISEISEIAVHPKNPRLIYISAIHSGVHRSTDGGVTWINLTDGMPTTDVMRVRIAPGYPVRVFAVTLKHGIFRLVDEELTEDFLSINSP